MGAQVIRQYVYGLVAVSPKDGRHSSLIMPWVDAETMSVFLAHTAQEFQGDHCLMFLDGASWHIAKDLRIPSSMRLRFLPPYSPELNPVEHIWDHIRENYFGNKTFPTLNAVEDRLCLALKTLENQLEILQPLTSFPWFNTLSLMYN